MITVSAIADRDGKCGGKDSPIWAEAGNFSGYFNDDSFASFSNYGPVVDLAAPGVKINSTYLNGTYALKGGTSMSAPHVTGAVALMKSMTPNMSPPEIRQELIQSGSTLDTVCNNFGHGYFNQDLDRNPEPLLYVRGITSSDVSPSNGDITSTP